SAAPLSRRYPEPVRPVAIVPHTHWDREWYAPFQVYRVRLVRLVDSLLDLLERDPSYERFLLDGQTALLDDYLEVRPEAEGRGRALVEAGGAQIGAGGGVLGGVMGSGGDSVRGLPAGARRG